MIKKQLKISLTSWFADMIESQGWKDMSQRERSDFINNEIDRHIPEELKTYARVHMGKLRDDLNAGGIIN